MWLMLNGRVVCSAGHAVAAHRGGPHRDPPHLWARDERVELRDLIYCEISSTRAGSLLGRRRLFVAGRGQMCMEC